MIKKALQLATSAHLGQQYGKLPYIVHLEHVAEIAKKYTNDEEIIAACYLHDILEDTKTSYSDLRKCVEEGVAEIVYAVTDELGRNRKERKFKTYPKIIKNDKAVFVKICDRIANVAHSRITNKDLFKMYKREQEEFEKYFRNENTEMLFVELDNLFGV